MPSMNSHGEALAVPVPGPRVGAAATRPEWLVQILWNLIAKRIALHVGVLRPPLIPFSYLGLNSEL